MDVIRFLIDFILHIDVHLAELVAQYGVWVYAILFLMFDVETIFLFPWSTVVWDLGPAGLVNILIFGEWWICNY